MDMVVGFDGLFLFLLGLLVGSFLNVCIYRLPLGESVVCPPSNCPRCGAWLRPWDLIPVLSWLALKGRCRYCATPVSPRYAVVELLTGMFSLWAFWFFGWSTALIKALFLVSFLLVITFIDLEHQLILDKVLLWMIAAGAAFVVYAGPATVDLLWLLLAVGAGGGALLLVAVLSRGGMGGGDIKLMAVLGLWLGWPETGLALFLSFVLGKTAGLLLLASGRKQRQDPIPFAPYIAAAAWLAFLYGKGWISWYLGIFAG